MQMQVQPMQHQYLQLASMSVYHQPIPSPQKKVIKELVQDTLTQNDWGAHPIHLLPGRPTVMQVAQPSITTRQSTSGTLVMIRFSKPAWLKKKLKKLRFSLAEISLKLIRVTR
jgi:hypothetical protein